MKVCGKTINFKVLVFYIIKILNIYLKDLIIKILNKLKIFGWGFKVNKILNLGEFHNDIKEGVGKLYLSNNEKF